jgi:hypothetical protein
VLLSDKKVVFYGSMSINGMIPEKDYVPRGTVEMSLLGD